MTRAGVLLLGVLLATTPAMAQFTPAASLVESLLKFVMASLAYTATGLLVVEVSNNRRRLLESFANVQREQQLRRKAEEQLRILAESSPAAIVTLNAKAEVLAANRAAHDMLGEPPGSLSGRCLEDQFPKFANALKVAAIDRLVRTSVAGWARRSDGHLFPIQAWFSVYGHGSDRCLAAIIVDMSEEVRDREREHFQHLLDYNRLLASAVSHEIRNLCSAISVVCSNLGTRQDLRGNADFDALTRLVGGLTELASLDLRASAHVQERRADLKAVLDHLQVVIAPDWDEIGGRIEWRIPDAMPAVAANAHGLLQIFLNLCQNSLRAVESQPAPCLVVSARIDGDDAVITFADNGAGVDHPDELFHLHPAGTGNGGSGLGLYISRELARSVGGELRHVEQRTGGACFQVLVPLVRGASLTETPRAS